MIMQECSIVIMRLLLPQLFEKKALHELRALVADERSMLNIHIKGEVIEVPPNHVGILLEGFLAQEAKSLITPPVVLFSPDTDFSFFSLESCGKIFLF
jgi:hypothetical protein